jgi:hypothetical protein
MPVRLGEFPAIRDFTLDVLHSATCDGSALLVIPPLYWSGNSAITGFGQAMASIGLLTVLVSLGLVITFRHKMVIRDRRPSRSSVSSSWEWRCCWRP